MYYLIYKITNKINNKIYIGAHKTENIYDDYMGSGKYLKYSQEKYGLENFSKEILFIFDNLEDMYAKEAELVNEEFVANENTYNLILGGQGGFEYINSTGKNIYGKNGQSGYGLENLKQPLFLRNDLSEEQFDEIRKKISDTLRKQFSEGRVGSFKNKTHSSESREKIKEAINGKQIGELNSQFGTRWIISKELKISKKIKKDDSIPEGWELGCVFDWDKWEKKEKERIHKIAQKEKLLDEKVKQYEEWFKIYDSVGFEKFVEITNYEFTQSSLVQNFSKYILNFIPQNGKKRQK